MDQIMGVISWSESMEHLGISAPTMRILLVVGVLFLRDREYGNMALRVALRSWSHHCRSIQLIPRYRLGGANMSTS